MFRAKVRASRKANCAVGGQGLPVLASVTAAQSPTAHNPVWSGAASVPSTSTAPCLLTATGKVLINGLGAVPAVHPRVCARISSGGFRITTPGRASARRVLSLKVTPRSPIRLSAYAASGSLNSGRRRSPACTRMICNNREQKIFIAWPVAATLLAMWAINFAPGTSAQEEHRHAHAPASAKQLKNPLSVTEENVASGRAMFNQHCASCHGADGRAQTETGAAMKVKPADLTGSAVHGRTPGEIYWVITNGIMASGMPAFKDKMGEQERWQTVLYVQRLQGEHQHAAASKAPEAAPKQDAMQR